ncbi:hypothetical protein AAF712_005285 [Marasmius tenuissimus]|uniref:Structure-specific endonuclease subunit SLX4 n=1 Tax=Marasmius tenuissimus TaxID=585030 RepID=A0ABR3A1Y6_9AGAR
MAPREIGDDFVEDSEPEREAIRRAATRPVQVRKSKSPPPVTKSLHATRNPTFARDTSPISIIEISDDSITTSQPKGSNTPRIDAEFSSILELSSSSLSSILPIPRTKNNASNGVPTTPIKPNEEDLPSDDELPSLGLGKFTFNPTKAKGTAMRPSTRPFTTSATASLDSVNSLADTKNARKNSKKKIGAGSRLSDDLSDAELAQLLKCVACDVRWTVRKSASQKVAHIQSCAKKSGLTDETVLTLIRDELAQTPIAPLDKGKGKAPPETQPTTILAEIVQDAAPKKRARRQDVAATVRSLGETRSAILDRAQCRERYHPRERFKPPPATPEFGASYLARTRGSKQSIFGSPSRLDDHEGPIFPTLNPISMPLPNVLTVSDASNKDVSMATPKKSTSNDTPLVYLSSSSSDSSPMYPTATKEYQDSTFSRPRSRLDSDINLEYPQDQDDVYLHYSPPPTPPPIHDSTIPTPLWDDGHIPVDTPAPCTPVSKTKSNTPLAKTTKKRRKQAPKGSEPEPQFDEAWEEQMRSKILANKELHLRILRFEPIPFKTFLDFTVGSEATASGKLKLSLRQFLDKQAIIFYDEENMGRRRR